MIPDKRRIHISIPNACERVFFRIQKWKEMVGLLAGASEQRREVEVEFNLIRVAESEP